MPAAAQLRVREAEAGEGQLPGVSPQDTGCCVGVLSLWGPHPGGLNRPSTPSDLTIADLYPLTLTPLPCRWWTGQTLWGQG